MLAQNAVFQRDASGRPSIPLEPETLYAFAHLIRLTEQLLLELFEKGLLSGTTHTAIGQEFSQMGVVRALSAPGDAILSNHRNHGHFLTYSGDFSGLLAEIMGRADGVCGGRGGSQHMAWRHFHSNGVQGGMTAIGAGHALARKLRGQAGVVAVCIGDGTLGQGLVYEAMNLAACWSAPALFVVERNEIAQTTPTAWTTPGDPLARGAAFGLRTWHLDDAAPDFFERVVEAVDAVRHEGRPGFLLIETRRLGPHSKGDDLRDAAEIGALRARDPLTRLGAQLDPERRMAIEAANHDYLAAARRRAEASPEARWAAAPAPIHAAGALPGDAAAVNTDPATPRNVRASLNEALRRLLAEDPEVLLLGEDLHEPYGGAFKVTAGLSDEFPGRVLSTPISEAGVVGAGIGLALDGFRPIVEIMFADFTGLVFDQLYNHAVKFPALDPSLRVPLIVRTPAGGRRGYGPTHSQSPENFLTSIPGLTVLYPSQRHDAGAVLATCSRRWPYPTVFLEHKLLYGQPQAPGPFRALPAHPDDAGAALFPTLAAGAADPDVTLLTYGGMTALAEAAAARLEDEELAWEIVVPALLSPLPRHTLVEHLRGRRRIVIVEESHTAFGAGAEMAAALLESGFTGQLRRVGAPAMPIPSARSLETAVLPGEDDIVEVVLRLF